MGTRRSTFASALTFHSENTLKYVSSKSSVQRRRPRTNQRVIKRFSEALISLFAKLATGGIREQPLLRARVNVVCHRDGSRRPQAGFMVKSEKRAPSIFRRDVT